MTHGSRRSQARSAPHSEPAGQQAPRGLTRRHLLQGAFLGACAWLAGSRPPPTGAGAARVLRGVNLNGAEFGVGGNLGGTGSGDSFSNRNRGTPDGEGALSYHYPTEDDFAFLARRRVSMVRLPVRWERLQPVLGGPLDSAELRRLVTTLDVGAAHGIKVGPALVSYGAYWVDEGGVGIRRAIGSAGGPTVAQFAGFWEQVAAALASRSSTLAAYGLSGEPVLDPNAGHRPEELWELASSEACRAIAHHDRWTPIAVSVHGYNLATDPRSSHPAGPWITGVRNPIWYEAHQYFFWQGEEETYAQSLAFAQQSGYRAGPNPDALHTRALTEAARFRDWLDGATGYIGETGWSRTEGAQQWNALAGSVYRLYNECRFHVTAWGAGSWWPADEPLLIYGASRNITLDTAYTSASVVEAADNRSHWRQAGAPEGRSGNRVSRGGR